MTKKIIKKKYNQSTLLSFSTQKVVLRISKNVLLRLFRFQSTAAWHQARAATTPCPLWARGARWPTPASPAPRTSACSPAAARTRPTTRSTRTATSATTALGQMGEICFVDVG